MSSSINIEQLLEQCKQNNRLAQMNVYKAYCNAMYNVAFRIVKNEAIAEDVVQEAFLTAFTDLDKLGNYEAFGSWLKKIVTFKSINELRKNKNVLTPLEGVAYKLTDSEPEELDVANLKVQEVFKLINKLKDNYRLLLTLHFVEGYDYDEIVEITGLSYANCRTTISRAKESLRKKMAVYA